MSVTPVVEKNPTAAIETAPTAEHGEVETTSEIKHEPTIYAETVGHIGSMPITNSLLNSWLAVLLIVVASVVLRRRLADIPRGIQHYAELILEGALNVADSVTNSRAKSLQFLPFVLPIFFFILINNWLGIVPGVGTFGFIEMHDGHSVFVPLLRGGTADLNTTLALSIMAVIATHIIGVLSLGVWSHLNRFINLQALWGIGAELKRGNFTAILINPIHFFVGLLEIVGELAKVASLSFRLFGNVFAGEVLLGVMASILAYALPIPFIFMELAVGLIQGLIFAMLTLVFLVVMSTSHDEHDHGEAPAH